MTAFAAPTPAPLRLADDAPPAGDPREQRPLRTTCPVCESRRLRYAFSHHGYRVVRCGDCRLMFLNPQPSDAELGAIYGADYFLGDDTPAGRASVAGMKGATARLYLDLLARYRGGHRGRLLEVGCGQGHLLAEARQLGYDVTGADLSPTAADAAGRLLGDGGRVFCGQLEGLSLPPGSFDVCVLADVIEHVRDPVEFLRVVRRLLAPGGAVLIATPSLDSWSARLLRQDWMEWKPEHLTYFDRNTAQNALFRAGYRGAVVCPARKALNLEYVARHFQKYPVPLFSRLVAALARVMPERLRRRNLSVVPSGIVVIAEAAEVFAESPNSTRPGVLGGQECPHSDARNRQECLFHQQGESRISARRKLSVIVPAYNEAATVDALMRSLLRKEVPGLDIEIIVVESNSTDGTRAIAERFAHHPRVKLVLEDRPRGKGRAVRTGFDHATGDFVLIQDADLEYDLEDYDALLEPLAQGAEAFVLGSRHGGSFWKMRRFAHQRLLSSFLNGGHWFFTTLVNVLFNQRLRDPFTMYKVFRRDCLFGLTFECNRFDFDFELLIKLLRKGYRPLEIPVNYRSRSFKEGKKVSVWRDPLTWVRALVRLRLARIDPLGEVERQARSQTPARANRAAPQAA